MRFTALTRYDVQELLTRAERHADTLHAAKERLTEDMPTEEFAMLLAEYEAFVGAAQLANQVAHIRFDVATESQEARTRLNQVDQRLTDASAKTLFFTLTLKQWPERLRELQDELPRYAGWLRNIARHAPFTLSEPEERVLTYLGASEDALLKIYDTITSAMRITITVDGEEKTISRAEAAPYATHPERSVRKQVADGFKERYEEEQTVLTDIYVGLMNDSDRESVRLRKYPSAIAARHHANDIPKEAYQALAAVTAKNQLVFQEYLELKRRALGYDEFTKYDFGAPVSGKPEKTTWEESVKAVEEAFGGFAQWFLEDAKSVLANGCVDAEPRDDKRGGACCYGMTPQETPFVLLNHTGAYEDTFTLAHELGHAVHDLRAAEQSVLQYHSPLVLAETASNWAEILLLDHEKRRLGMDAQKALLCFAIDEALGSVSAQMRYTRFEEWTHAHLQEGGDLSRLHERWADLMREDWPALDLPETSVQWLGIPHLFRSPFYCYSYSFGALLVYALWEDYQERGEAFAEDLKELLAAGGSTEPRELLARFGYDITSEAFWEQGFATITRWVDELRGLLEQDNL